MGAKFLALGGIFSYMTTFAVTPVGSAVTCGKGVLSLSYLELLCKVSLEILELPSQLSLES